MTPQERLDQIAEIIDNRCMAADGPVSSTLEEMTGEELRRIYTLASLSTEELPGPIKPYSKKNITERHKRDWENFLYKLSGAIRLSGGMGDESHMDEIENSRLKDVYDHLYPNKIKFVLSICESDTKEFG